MYNLLAQHLSPMAEVWIINPLEALHFGANVTLAAKIFAWQGATVIKDSMKSFIPVW